MDTIKETVDKLIRHEERKLADAVDEHNKLGTLDEKCMARLKDDLVQATTPLYHIRADLDQYCNDFESMCDEIKELHKRVGELKTRLFNSGGDYR